MPTRKEIEASEWVIYALCDPRTKDVRYIGKTINLVERFKQHLAASRKGKLHKDRWIHTLLVLGMIPKVKVLETGNGPGWDEAERSWIAKYRAASDKITNVRDGGQEGAPPAKATTPSLDEMKAFVIGKSISEYERTKPDGWPKTSRFVPLYGMTCGVMSGAALRPSVNRSDEFSERMTEALLHLCDVDAECKDIRTSKLVSLSEMNRLLSFGMIEEDGTVRVFDQFGYFVGHHPTTRRYKLTPKGKMVAERSRVALAAMAAGGKPALPVEPNSKAPNHD